MSLHTKSATGVGSATCHVAPDEKVMARTSRSAWRFLPATSTMAGSAPGDRSVEGLDLPGHAHRSRAVEHPDEVQGPYRHRPSEHRQSRLPLARFAPEYLSARRRKVVDRRGPHPRFPESTHATRGAGGARRPARSPCRTWPRPCNASRSTSAATPPPGRSSAQRGHRCCRGRRRTSPSASARPAPRCPGRAASPSRSRPLRGRRPTTVWSWRATSSSAPSSPPPPPSSPGRPTAPPGRHVLRVHNEATLR